MTKVQRNGAKDYNSMVDEILMLKTEEVQLTKRKYKTRKQRDNIIYQEIKDKSEPSSIKNNVPESKMDKSDDYSESNNNLIGEFMKISDIDMPDFTQDLFVSKNEETQNFDCSSKIRNDEELFLNKFQTDLPTFTSKLDNIWSTNTSEFDFPMYY